MSHQIRLLYWWKTFADRHDTFPWGVSFRMYLFDWSVWKNRTYTFVIFLLSVRKKLIAEKITKLNEKRFIIKKLWKWKFENIIFQNRNSSTTESNISDGDTASESFRKYVCYRPTCACSSSEDHENECQDETSKTEVS